MKFHVEDDNLAINLEGIERFWAFKARIVVPKVNIARMNWQQEFTIWRRELGWRVGTTLPGLVAGQFYGKNGVQFVYLRHTRGLRADIWVPHVLVVETRDFQYRRLLLTMDDPAMASQLVAWWSGNA